MTQKTILIVEDNELLGTNLKEAFEDRNFRAIYARNRKEALSVDNAPDLAVLDMNLGEEKTGAEVGMEIRSKFKSRPPEFIINSAYNDPNYLHSAMRLGAAVYLVKSQDNYRSIITHARILAIRRVIRHSQQTIPQLVMNCHTVSDAIQAAARKILSPELHECLGAKFCVLFSNNGEHQCIDSNLELPKRHLGYALIQRMVADIVSPEYLDLNRCPLDLTNVPVEIQPRVTKLQELLGKAVVINLYEKDGFQLSLGIKSDPNIHECMREKAENLADVIGRHFRSELIEKLLSTTHLIAEQEVCKSTVGSFCTNMGRMHENLYRKAQEMGEVAPGATVLPEFVKLGLELQAVGGQLETPKEQPKQGRVEMYQLVEGVWRDLARERQLSKELLELGELNDVEGHQGSLYVAVKRILEWMVDRFSKCGEILPKIAVYQVVSLKGKCLIHFKDYSKRLPALLLQDIFRPFSSPMENESIKTSIGIFTAKTLIEAKNQGYLAEQSKRLDEDHGHLFELCLKPFQEEQGGEA